MIRRGKLVFDGQYAPMTSTQLHRMYSCSKSFVSMAIGLLAQRGSLTLDDTAVSFFPEWDTPQLHPWLRETTVRDLLRMADCHDDTTYQMEKTPPDMDWVCTYFETPPTHRSGTVFQYNTACTVILSVIVERVAGMSFVEVLRPAVFEPMGMSPGITCVRTPCGHSWGGSGVLASAHDMAKMAFLCMRGGEADGRQLLPRWYVEQAVSRQIDNTLHNDNCERQQGYGYQIWRIRNEGFAFCGMGSQQAFCFPKEDLLVVMTGDTQAAADPTGRELSALWDTIFPALREEALPEDAQAQAHLQALEEGLTLMAEQGASASPLTLRVQGRRYAFAPNAMGMQWARFDFETTGGTLTYANGTGEHEIRFGYGKNVEQMFSETSFYAMDIGHAANRPFHAYASGAWKDDAALHITLYIADVCFGTMQMSCVFQDDTLTLGARKSAEWFFTSYQGFATGKAEA
ncbi:MAG: serine hydrolase [Eubacteriales bacterium]|nr:serine hydrolase [Eubacteriales bacterium]